jgi:hypothetical protein
LLAAPAGRITRWIACVGFIDRFYHASANGLRRGGPKDV